MARSKQANICINIMSSLNHIELLQYDVLKGSFVKVDSEECMFDPATRDLLDDLEQFKSHLKRLYGRNKVPLKAPTTLILPSFFTRQFNVPENVLGEDLKLILISEAERFYVFKRIDPEVGYTTLKSGQVLYTAYPKQPLETICRAFQELKIPLLSIDCNYTATLRGLIAMGVVKEEVANNTKWGLMIASDFSVFMAVVEGSQMEKTLEAPLPLQNADEDALLKEIKDDFTQFFSYEVLSQMIIINNSVKLYSTALVDNLGYQGTIDVFVQNDRTLGSRGAEEAPFPCSLEAVGGSLVNVYRDAVPPLEMSEPGVMDSYVDEDKLRVINGILLGLGIVLVILRYGAGFALTSFTDSKQKEGTQLQAQIQTSLNSLSIVPEVKRKLFIKQGTAQNYKISNLVVKVDQALPPDVWLRTVQLRSSPDFKNLDISIDGSALAPDTLSAYVKEINTELGTPPLTPSIFPRQEGTRRYFDYALSNAVKKPGR